MRQYPWGTVSEVERKCREPGSKLSGEAPVCVMELLRMEEKRVSQGSVSDEWEGTVGRGAHRLIRAMGCSYMAWASEGWKTGEGAASA